MSAQRYVAACGKLPGVSHCSLRVAGTQHEVVKVLIEHVVSEHGRERTPQLIDELRRDLECEPPGALERASNREVAEILFDAFNRRDFDTIESLASDSTVMTNATTGEVFHGRKGFRAHAEEWVSALPDARVEIDRLVPAEDGFMVELTGSGTHRGTLATPAGPIPPTGRHLSFRLLESMVVRDGKVVEARSYADALGMLAQLGLIGARPPAPEHMQQSAQTH